MAIAARKRVLTDLRTRFWRGVCVRLGPHRASDPLCGKEVKSSDLKKKAAAIVLALVLAPVYVVTHNMEFNASVDNFDAKSGVLGPRFFLADQYLS